MNRIERILEDWSWIFKIILVIVWFLWAAGLFGPLMQSIKEESQKTYDPRMEQEIRRIALIKVKEAKALGNSYSPQKYFDDLVELSKLSRENNVAEPQTEISDLWSLSFTNWRKGYFTSDDIEKARETYEKWNEESISHRQEFFQQVKQSGLSKILNWLLTFYLRSMLLSFALYIVRMAQRRGILETSLADKKKLFLAVAGWVFYLFRYPNNVVKEIVVEAELRRLGGLFRKLSLKEKAVIQQVANSAFYKEWLAAFRTYQPIRFQRSLMVAILGTIILYVLCPAVNVSASPRKQKQQSSEYGTVFLNKASPTAKADLAKVNQKQEKLQKFNLEKWIVTSECILTIHLPLFKWLSSKISTIWKNRFIKKIDHIPVIDCLVSRLTKTLNQIVEGICFLRLKSGGNNEKVICGNFGSVGACLFNRHRWKPC